MSQVPADLHYAKTHEWVKSTDDGTLLVGITDYAQNSLGDITYVQLPKAGTVLKLGDTFGVIESVKAASDLYSPVSGTVVAVNSQLDSAPETINQAPYTDGWIMRLQPKDPGELQALLDAAGYTALSG